MGHHFRHERESHLRNGKLIGALAFAWSFSKEPIAGVTPIRQMAENYQPDASAASLYRCRKTLRPARRRCCHRTALSASESKSSNARSFLMASDRKPADNRTMMLTPIATPVMVSGLGPRSMKALGDLLEPFGLIPMAGGGKAPVKMGTAARNPVRPSASAWSAAISI